MKALEIFMLFGFLFPFFVYFLNKWYIKRNIKKGNMAAVEEGLRNIRLLKKMFFSVLIIVSLVVASVVVMYLSASGY